MVEASRKGVAQILSVRAIRLLGLALVSLLSLAVVTDAKGGGGGGGGGGSSSSSSSSSGGYSSSSSSSPSYGSSGSAVNPSSSKGGYVSPGSRTSTYQYQPTYSPSYYVPPAQPRYNSYSRTRYNNNRYVSYGPAYSYNRGYGYYRGPRGDYYNSYGYSGTRGFGPGAVVVIGAGTAGMLIWATAGNGYSPYGYRNRHGFYPRDKWCTQPGYFKFGSACRKCSTGPCPDGQYRTFCTGGSDSYCTKCTNTCPLFVDGPPVIGLISEKNAKTRAWIVTADTVDLGTNGMYVNGVLQISLTGGASQVEWKSNGATIFSLSWRKNDDKILVNYCREKGFSVVGSCQFLGNAAEVPYKYFDPMRSNTIHKWTVIMDESGHYLLSSDGEVLYRRSPSNSLVSQQYGPISFVKVDQNFYAGKRVFLEEMEQGTCAYSPAVLNGTVIISGTGVVNSPAVLNGTDIISGSVLSIPFQNTAMGPNAYCDPNAMGNPGCVYTSEGTPGRAMSNCQIEACCKDCLNADAAKQRGFKSMCPLIPENTPATVNFELEVPMAKAEVENPIDPTTGAKNQYRDVIAQTVFSINRNSSIASWSAMKDKINLLWVNEKTATITDVNNALEPGSGLTALSTLVAVEVSTTASQLDATWSLLSEEAINAAAFAANLAPVIVFHPQEPTVTGGGSSTGVIIGISVTAAVLMCCCCGCFCMGHAKQRGSDFGSNDNFPGTTSDNSPVWEKYEWDRIPNQFKEHWMVMGWDEAMWNAGGKASTDNMSWSELSKDQQNSATALGYTQDRWDNSIPITSQMVPGGGV